MTESAALKKKRRISPVIVIVALLLLVLIGGYFINRARGPSVEAVAAQSSRVVDRVVAIGKVIPPSKVRVGSAVLGTVVTVTVDEGDEVGRGKLLIGLEDAEARAMVSQAKASVAQAEAKLAQVGGVGARVALETAKQARLTTDHAWEDLERERTLFSRGASTQELVDTAQKAYDIALSAKNAAFMQASSSGPGGGDYRAAASAVAQSRASLEAAEARLALTKIVAPSDCVVLQRQVEPGDVVQPGKVLMVLARKGATGLSVQVDEKNLALIRLGQAAVGSADAYGAETFGARVTFIAPSVDALKGTVEVKLLVDKPPSFLISDMTVSVVIEGGTREKVLLIPADALRDGSSSNPFVMVLLGHQVERRTVQLGLRAGEKVEIIGGLKDGETVVMATSKPLNSGQRVRAKLVMIDEAQHAL